MLYDHEKSLKATEERIRASNISRSNKQLIFKFESYCFAEGLSIARVLKHLTELKLLADMAGNDFKSITRQDMMKLVEHIERMTRAERTKQDYKKYTWWLKAISGADEVQARRFAGAIALEIGWAGFQKWKN